jgi:hypothetical protein
MAETPSRDLIVRPKAKIQPAPRTAAFKPLSGLYPAADFHIGKLGHVTPWGSILFFSWVRIKRLKPHEAMVPVCTQKFREMKKTAWLAALTKN